MIEWMEVDEFLARFNERYRKSQIYIDPQIQVEAGLSELKESIPVEPEVYSGGLEEPGPCQRWYGSTGDLLFSIVHYDDKNTGTTLIATRPAQPSHEKYPWSLLKKFV